MLCKILFIFFLNLCFMYPAFANCASCEVGALESQDSKNSEAVSKAILPAKEPYELMIFVSLAMPEQSLKLWAEQAARLGVPLRIRGFYKESLQKTTQKSFELFGKEKLADLIIDPESFETYVIQAVPAVVLALAPREIPEPIPSLFEVVYGDTSLEAALRLIADQGCMEARTIATQLLNRCRKGAS